ncbi:MAG: mechanosensitive ion channel family protein [Gemmatimonadales bacterium]
MVPGPLPMFSLGDILRRIAELLSIDSAEVVRSSIRVLAVWLLAFLAYRLVELLARRIEKTVDDGDETVTTTRERRGKTIAQLLRSVGRVVIVTIALLLTFNIFIDIGPILAGAGILGLAISFGAQSLVKDVISGFFILFENQFAIGDVIEVAGKSGTVEKMTLRVVVLRDVYGVMHVVPNGEIKVVSNKTRGWSRAVVDVSVARDVDIDGALSIVRDEAGRFSGDPKWKPELDGPVEVLGVESVGDSGVVIRSLIRTRPGSQWTVGREFRRRMKARLFQENIEIPYPERKPNLRTEGVPSASGAANAAPSGSPRG